LFEYSFFENLNKNQIDKIWLLTYSLGMDQCPFLQFYILSLIYIFEISIYIAKEYLRTFLTKTKKTKKFANKYTLTQRPTATVYLLSTILKPIQVTFYWTHDTHIDTDKSIVLSDFQDVKSISMKLFVGVDLILL